MGEQTFDIIGHIISGISQNGENFNNDLINKMFSLFEFNGKGFGGLCKLIYNGVMKRPLTKQRLILIENFVNN